MIKRLAGLVFALFMVEASSAQVQSPEQFLGYKVGERFTPHWKVVDYFRHVAKEASSMVKLQTYGQTNEGRTLLVVFVSQPEHISNLEAVRANNLRLASSFTDRNAGNLQAPAVVWLSYNVHGNEASSTEASMLTLYSLVDPRQTQSKQWLKNTVVAIDPCLNPDGRDRYVNWYNSVVGKNYNPSLLAREHNEPWPGGRSNHYNFDLNRDWAWQTQVESQQRVKLYHQWLPQIHVDFHEQYPDAPYYFAPAAEPYHEVITKWQRDFQHTIGRNHARYFDQQGWLYFTRQYFDLLYPSYGDTYPIYNGSIGMTYEQAGHGIAGLGVQMEKGGDTLTLTDRAQHHFTTSLSTIEVASQNTAKLLTEFQRYFNEATTTGIGQYKSYIVRATTGDEQRVRSLIDLLRKNGIRYGNARTGNVKGYNYDSGKEETVGVTATDLVIPAVQPKSALVKVLFEPKAALADSFTYDITAWSLPYAYGLKAWASTTPLTIGSEPSDPLGGGGAPSDAYGYVVRWNGLQSVRLAGALLQKGIRLRYSEEPFASGGQNFDRGSLIILKTGNQYRPGLWDTVRAIASRQGVQLSPVSSGFVEKGYDFGSNKVRTLSNRRVALLTGEGVSANAAGEVWYFFEQELDYPITLVNVGDVSAATWNEFDVVIMPSGRYPFLSDKNGAEAFRNWINGGGKVVALENAVSQLSALDWSIKARKSEDAADTKDTYAALKRYENREREFLPNVTPGSIFRVELDNTHPLAFGYPGYYYTLKQDDRIYDFIKEGGWNVGVIKKNRQLAGFVGSRLQARLQDGLIFGVQEMGRGTITYLTDDVLFRNFWQNGKLMFANAVFLVGQ